MSLSAKIVGPERSNGKMEIGLAIRKKCYIASAVWDVTYCYTVLLAPDVSLGGAAKPTRKATSERNLKIANSVNFETVAIPSSWLQYCDEEAQTDVAILEFSKPENNCSSVKERINWAKKNSLLQNLGLENL
ncbi:Protein of unknown function [Gryllus bimaculatus]|nr:Protein of unknown function [Gryllus bimaculatus]